MSEKSVLDEIKDHFKDPKNAENIRKHFAKRNIKHLMFQSQAKRFHEKLFNHRTEKVIDKIIAKYESEAYYYRWFKRGIEPQKALFWLILEVAKIYGEKAPDEYYDMFVSEAYIYSNYVVKRLDGQGSVVQIEKFNE